MGGTGGERVCAYAAGSGAGDYSGRADVSGQLLRCAMQSEQHGSGFCGTRFGATHWRLLHCIGKNQRRTVEIVLGRGFAGRDGCVDCKNGRILIISSVGRGSAEVEVCIATNCERPATCGSDYRTFEPARMCARVLQAKQSTVCAAGSSEQCDADLETAGGHDYDGRRANAACAVCEQEQDELGVSARDLCGQSLFLFRTAAEQTNVYECEDGGGVSHKRECLSAVERKLYWRNVALMMCGAGGLG